MKHSLETLAQIVKEEFEAINLPRNPAGLYLPIEYSLEQGGKRIRPMLSLIGCAICDGDVKKAIPSAKGLEIFHNFTLLHDDIMDNAPIRRGKESVFKKFGTNSAILSGDTMFVVAYEHITQSDDAFLRKILELFNTTAREVCEGQQYDMEFETRDDVSIDEYIEMIRLKTAVLLAGSLKSGAIAANASHETAQALYDYGINIGLAFQLKDDLLDAFGNQDLFGKKTGNDIVSNKKTYLFLKAADLADEKTLANLKGAYKLSSADFKVTEVLKIYSQLKIEEHTNLQINKYFNQAFEILESLNISDEGKELLESFTKLLMDRIK